MRQIDADVLKNLVEKVACCGLIDLDVLKIMIDDLPAINAVSWIPCKEKLPEPTQEVLVTGTSGCVYTSRIVHGEFEYGGNVIAWMPLPEPYVGERKDDETNRR